jgi:hypothetical protein
MILGYGDVITRTGRNTDVWMNTADDDLINLDHVLLVRLSDHKSEDRTETTYWTTIDAVLPDGDGIELWQGEPWTSNVSQRESQTEVARNMFKTIKEKLTS